jgi:two-component system chemotaxis sensor kinase CheA
VRFVIVLVTGIEPEAAARAAGLPAGSATLFGSTAAPPSSPSAFPSDDELADETPARAGRVIRVPVARLDDALERLGALVVTRSRLSRAVADLAARGADVRELSAITGESSRQLRDLRAAIMRARMVSVAELLERVPLMVRGLGRATGKAVRLEIDAGRAELDKSVGERVFPAIVHLLRNAVDHALETPDERRRRGKPLEGLVRVVCHERGQSRLELVVSDDGAGIDREAVAGKAGRPVPASDEELLELIATPGLSTAARTTATSGRGMGVDIVRRIVRELGGELELASAAGRGTTFTIRVPLSITIVDAFAFSSAGQAFVAPVAGIEEILDVEPTSITPTPGANGAIGVGLIERRGAAIPVVHLDAAFGLARAAAASPSTLPAKALVVLRAGAALAFVVDRMLGQHEVVVRPVEDPLVRVAGVTGSTDLGDGRPTLVLDLSALGARLSLRAESPS